MMSKQKNITVRIQSSEGTKRVELPASATTCDLYEKVRQIFELNSFAFCINKGKSGKDEIPSSKSKTLLMFDLKHGDMLFMTPLQGASIFPMTNSNNNTSNQSNNPELVASGSGRKYSIGSIVNKSTSTILKNKKEDEVDLFLAKIDGKIERQRDSKLCRHNKKSRCFNCAPLEPFDEEYLQQHKIKHLSFHAYLRKMMSGADRGKFLALEDITCRIRPGCKGHLPWPKGICSKCQPNAITLNRQAYRHVDNVQFENANLVERFLNYWRITGNQRIGFLYGRYEVHPDVPLGIRAVVTAIYEPPQESTRDSVRLLDGAKDNYVHQLTAALDLKPVGWIFTDLVVENAQLGTVKHTRHVDTYFLSAQECFMAGYYQNEHPNLCKYSSNGYFGSKFVTIIVTGDKSNQVHMEGYQVSNQCMALVRDSCFVPTKDASELGFIRESTDKQYVPDVYYKKKDTYGNEVPVLARPLPVEYLLVDVPVSTPLIPIYTFNPDQNKEPFPIENRLVDGHIQDFNALSQYLSQFRSDEFLHTIRDFHLLLYIASMDMLPLKDCMEPLLEAIHTQDAAAAGVWASSEQWATLEQLIAASSPPNSRPGSAVGNIDNSGMTNGRQWTCKRCTFLNPSSTHSCEMCSLPRGMTQ